jgi:hypothetical protein
MPKVWNFHHKNAPKDAVYIGRGSHWGNHFVIGKDGDREEVVRKHKEYVDNDPQFKEFIRKHLKGKDLVCFCAPKACHGDFLLQIANEEN